MLVTAWLAAQRSEHTRRAYRADITRWADFCHDHDVDPLTARRPLVDLYARTLDGDGLKPRTRARRLASVSSFYAYLVDEQIRPSNPAAHAKRPAISAEGVTPGLNRDEMRRFLAAAREYGTARTVALLTLLATSGMRINEALAANVEDIGHDRGHRTLRIVRKGGAEARAVLTAPAWEALAAYLDGRQSGPLFRTDFAERMSQPEAWRAVRRIARRAGIESKLSPHSLRVAFITSAREAGVPLEDVQDAAGHKDPRTTRRYDRGRYSLDRHASYAVTAWLSET